METEYKHRKHAGSQIPIQSLPNYLWLPFQSPPNISPLYAKPIRIELITVYEYQLYITNANFTSTLYCVGKGLSLCHAQLRMPCQHWVHNKELVTTGRKPPQFIESHYNFLVHNLGKAKFSQMFLCWSVPHIFFNSLKPVVFLIP